MAKIVIIHHSGILGGAGVSLLNTIKALAHTHELNILIPSDPQDIKNELLKIQNKYKFNFIEYGHRIGALTYYSGGDCIFSLRFFYRCFLLFLQFRYWNRLLSDIDPDIVIVNSLILSWMSCLRELKRRTSVCFVRETICGSGKHLMNKLHHKFLSKFDKVSFLTNYDARLWDIGQGKFTVIRNFIDVEKLNNTITRKEALEKLNLRPESFYVLYVGGVSHMKGFDIAVKSVLSCPEVELIAAGNNFEECAKIHNGNLSSFENDIKDYIIKNDSDSRIHLFGRQSDMSYYYAAADVLIFPMRSIHQARPIFEAGWFSKPAIVTKSENLHEDLSDGINGLMFDINRPEELTKHILFLKENTLVAERMGKNNYKMSIDNHSQQINASQIKDLINSLL